MKYSPLFLGLPLAGFIVGSMVFSCSSGKPAETDNVSTPVLVKVYSAE
jgi:hypothetical protein